MLIRLKSSFHFITNSSREITVRHDLDVIQITISYKKVKIFTHSIFSFAKTEEIVLRIHI